MVASSSSKEETLLTLVDAHLSAIRAWLSSTSGIEELRHTIQSSPVAFLAAHIHSLPAHLLEPFASITTAQQRSSIPLVLDRRRRWAARHKYEEASAGKDNGPDGGERQAHILDLEASRQRLPELWASIVGQSSSISRRTLRRRPTRPRAQQQLDPPFPDHPAATVNGYETAAAASGSARKYGAAHQGDLFSHPRLARLIDEQDEEEAQEAEREREARQAEEPEEEEEEDEDSDGEMDEELVEVFRRAVVERFVKGDPTLPASLYASVDFDAPSGEGTTASSSSSSSSSRVEQNDSMMRPSRQQELLDEERYFDDDEDDEAPGPAESDATNAEIDY